MEVWLFNGASRVLALSYVPRTFHWFTELHVFCDLWRGQPVREKIPFCGILDDSKNFSRGDAFLALLLSLYFPFDALCVSQASTLQTSVSPWSCSILEHVGL
jgi:hypothetical protein